MQYYISSVHVQNLSTSCKIKVLLYDTYSLVLVNHLMDVYIRFLKPKSKQANTLQQVGRNAPCDTIILEAFCSSKNTIFCCICWVNK